MADYLVPDTVTYESWGIGAPWADVVAKSSTVRCPVVTPKVSKTADGQPVNLESFLIATAKRLGAVIEASDVRPAAKEQIESLGGKFIDVPFETDEEREIATGVGGYARPMPAAWMARQATLVAERCKQADIVISTALIPGRPAPTLISEETVRAMKPGSVIVDLAVERGGNCPLSQKGLVVQENGVTLVGLTNLPGMVATDASALYARNLLDFLKLIIDKEGNLAIARDDEIVVACLMCEGGQVVRKK